MSFDNTFDLTAGVYFNFYNTSVTGGRVSRGDIYQIKLDSICHLAMRVHAWYLEQ